MATVGRARFALPLHLCVLASDFPRVAETPRTSRRIPLLSRKTRELCDHRAAGDPRKTVDLVASAVQKDEYCNKNTACHTSDAVFVRLPEVCHHQRNCGAPHWWLAARRRSARSRQ